MAEPFDQFPPVELKLPEPHANIPDPSYLSDPASVTAHQAQSYQGQSQGGNGGDITYSETVATPEHVCSSDWPLAFTLSSCVWAAVAVVYIVRRFR